MKCPRCGRDAWCSCSDYQLRSWERDHHDWQYGGYDQSRAYKECEFRLRQIDDKKEEERQAEEYQEYLANQQRHEEERQQHERERQYYEELEQQEQNEE